MKCESDHRSDEPFCPECGELSPSLISRGPLALEAGEVPSQVIRDKLLADLRLWFPEIDTAPAQRRLKAGPSILIRGMDEESGNRILAALRSLKVTGRLLHEPRDGWWHWLWNPGWAITAVALVPALLLGGIFGAFLLLASVAAPLAFAVSKGRRMRPLITPGALSSAVEPWVVLSQRYAAVVEKADPADAEALRALTREVFDIRRSLRSESVEAIAAGGPSGDLSRRLTDAVRTAVDITRRISEGSEGVKPELRKEFAQIRDLVIRTSNWFRTLEDQGTKQTSQLAEELRQVTQDIDRIVGEVRSPVPAAILSREKEPA